MARGDSARAKLDKLDMMLAHTATVAQDAALFAEIEQAQTLLAALGSWALANSD